jgi:hypothetical protein
MVDGGAISNLNGFRVTMGAGADNDGIRHSPVHCVLC